MSQEKFRFTGRCFLLNIHLHTSAKNRISSFHIYLKDQNYHQDNHSAG